MPPAPTTLDQRMATLGQRLGGPDGEYNFGRALRQLCKPGRFNPEGKVEGAALAAHQELREANQHLPDRGGLRIPLSARVRLPRAEARDLTTSSGSGAGQTVNQPLISALRSKMVCGLLGASTPNLPRGLANLPVVSATAQPARVSEGNAPTASNLTAAGISMTPHTVVGRFDVSRKFFDEAGTASLQDLIVEDLFGSLAAEADRVALTGGSTNEPVGLLASPDVTVYPLGTNGAAPSYAALVAIELAGATANVGNKADARPGWAAAPAVRAKLRQTEKITGGGREVWCEGLVLDAPAFATKSLPANLTKGSGSNLASLIYSPDWGELVIGHWGQIELIVDPYSGGTAGNVRLVALWDVDITVKHGAAFQVVKDAVTS